MNIESNSKVHAVHLLSQSSVPLYIIYAQEKQGFPKMSCLWLLITYCPILVLKIEPPQINFCCTFFDNTFWSGGSFNFLTDLYGFNITRWIIKCI